MKQAIPARPIQNPIGRFFVLGISTGLGLGYLPLAPGTWGSLLGIPLGLWFLELPVPLVVGLCIVLFFIFSALAERACHHWGQMDASRVVSDEVLGQAIAIAGIRSLADHGPLPQWSFVILSFLLFRIFDITKPFPARTFDRQGNGFGVVADDVVAGIYAALFTLALSKIWIHGL
ncbi:MAG: phosphatidylglycerophosphatase A [Bdellovibrionales bacterium]|nr:phosphatidylglycerophosphatase A [Bdellovibrionales bacterium]